MKTLVLKENTCILKEGEGLFQALKKEVNTYIDCDNPKEALKFIQSFTTTTEPVFTFVSQTNRASTLQIPEAVTKYISEIYDSPTEEFGNIQLSLSEAVLNAIEHGSLQMSEMKSKLISSNKYFEDFYNERDKRLKDPKCSKKLIMVRGEQIRNDLKIHIHDQGEGFDTEAEKVKLASVSDQNTGRGLRLIQSMSLDIDFSDGGKTCSILFPLWPEKTIQDRHASKHARQNGLVLIVDDDKTSLAFAKRTLTEAGYKNIITASSGEEAIQKATEYSPNLILLDIFMEGLDGFDTCRRLKRQKSTAHTPIIFVSGANGIDYRAKGFDLGAVDFLSKPIDPIELVARSETHLKNGMLIKDLKIYQQRVSSEMEQAHLMQMRLVPKDSDISHTKEAYKISMHALFQPSQELAGDYWNLFEIDDNKLGIFFADFTGHGLASALSTMVLHSALTEFESYMKDPLSLMEHIDERLRHETLSLHKFATAVYGIFNKKDKTFTYCGRGAPAIVWMKEKEKTYEFIDCSGVPLGLGWASLEETSFKQETMQLAAGDTLMFYSDALLECTHSNGERWFEAGLKSALDYYLKSDQILFSAIRQQFFRTVNTPLEDDLTLVTLHIMGESSSLP